MKLEQLQQKNPTYCEDTWLDYEALYLGGEAFHCRIDRFLIQNPNEPKDVFESRKKVARYRSYVGPILDQFAAQLMSAPMTIRLLDEAGEPVTNDEFYSTFKEDVDANGTDLVDFARDGFRQSLIKQWCWFVCSLPSDGGKAPVSQADWEARELGRVCLHRLEAEDVYDWEYDESGQLLWVLTFQQSSPRQSLVDSRSTVKYTFRLYDRSTITTFERTFSGQAEDKPKADSEIPVVATEPHGFTRVPFVQVKMPYGMWLLNRVADSQIAYFQDHSALRWAAKQTCYAMPVFFMENLGATRPPILGAGYFLQLSDKDKIDYLAPPSAPFDVIAAECKTQKDEIYRVAQQMAAGVDNNAAAVGRSAESKQADSSATEVCLKAYGAIVREALEKVFDLVIDGRRDALKVSVTGLDKFNLADASITVENTSKAKDIGIPSKTFTKELYVQTAESLLPSLEQNKKDEIRKEIESGVDEQIKAAEEAAKQMAMRPPVKDDAEDEAGEDDEQEPPSTPTLPTKKLVT
jgi:hypothetical protein